VGYDELDGTLGEEHAALRDTAHRFALDVLRPAGATLDQMSPEDVAAPDSALHEVLAAWWSGGNHTAGLPVELGGGGLDPLARHLVLEELGWGSAGLAIALGVGSMPFEVAARIAQLTGNDRLLEEVISPFASDVEARYVGCWAITEPQHGSDALSVGTEAFSLRAAAGVCRAVRDGTDWVLSGEKAAWVSNGSIATHALLFCTTEPDLGPAGGGVAFVPLDLPGVSRGRPLDKLGQRDLNQGPIAFDAVRIPEHLMLVTAELYPMALSSVLALANTGMSVVFTGLARAAFEEALGYARVREQGGRPIAGHQLVQSRLFSMFCEVESSRALSRAVLGATGGGEPPSLAHAIAAKVTCTQRAFDVANAAVQLHGGVGLARGVLVEKLFRDARASLVEDGVNEFLGLVGARAVLDGYDEQAP